MLPLHNFLLFRPFTTVWTQMIIRLPTRRGYWRQLLLVLGASIHFATTQLCTLTRIQLTCFCPCHDPFCLYILIGTGPPNQGSLYLLILSRCLAIKGRCTSIELGVTLLTKLLVLCYLHPLEILQLFELFLIELNLCFNILITIILSAVIASLILTWDTWDTLTVFSRGQTVGPMLQISGRDTRAKSQVLCAFLSLIITKAISILKVFTSGWTHNLHS